MLLLTEHLGRSLRFALPQLATALLAKLGIHELGKTVAHGCIF